MQGLSTIQVGQPLPGPSYSVDFHQGINRWEADQQTARCTRDVLGLEAAAPATTNDPARAPSSEQSQLLKTLCKMHRRPQAPAAPATRISGSRALPGLRLLSLNQFCHLRGCKGLLQLSGSPNQSKRPPPMLQHRVNQELAFID